VIAELAYVALRQAQAKRISVNPKPS